MAKAGPARGRSRQGSRAQGAAEAVERTIAVGRPLQARLIALEKRVGVFSEEQSFAADSRFNHPVVLPGAVPSVEGASGRGAVAQPAVPPADAVPEGMARIFAAELAALQRLGKDPRACHVTRIGSYTISCRSYFHFDGFRALLHVGRDGALVAAWQDEEVLHPDSPRRMISAVPDAEIEAFLLAAEGR